MPTAMPMSLSVIVPNFNHAKLIPRALRAFLNQSPPAKEIIVIDDGSTDDSVAVIEAIARRHPSIRLIRHQSNRGIVAAVRSGLDVATGEYLLFGSSDDYVLPGLYGRADAALRANPSAALFCSGVALVDDDNQIVGLRPVTAPRLTAGYLSPADVRRAIRSTDFWYLGTTTIYHRQILADAGYFDPKLGSIGDTLTDRLLAFRHGFCFDPTVLGVYNKDPNSFSARSALSVSSSLRVLDAARAWILAMLPEDVREEQQKLFDRRMRFGFARLWVVWSNGYPETDAIADILDFGSRDRKILSLLGRVPLLSGVLMLGWMTIRMRPFGLLAMAEAWRRSQYFKWIGRKRVQRAVDRIVNPAPVIE
ncbi:MAG TPA: glycosyltransferase family A protein [Xanthobacteraceae bacterium]|nr:glycosyltransferase family A protein [Xanthobacteraceae bacterium]